MLWVVSHWMPALRKRALHQLAISRCTWSYTLLYVISVEIFVHIWIKKCALSIGVSVVSFTGFYSYIEHSLRHILSQALDACTGSKNCVQCTHSCSYLHPLSLLLNLTFTCLAMYHLAYLGVMFDTSEEGEQEKGYSMLHTLSKWDNLGYSSHIVATCMGVFYWLVKWISICACHV